MKVGNEDCGFYKLVSIMMYDKCPISEVIDINEKVGEVSWHCCDPFPGIMEIQVTSKSNNATDKISALLFLDPVSYL